METGHTLDLARLHIVVPAYCEAKVVGETVHTLRKLYPTSSSATSIQRRHCRTARRAGATVTASCQPRQVRALQTGCEFALEAAPSS